MKVGLVRFLKDWILFIFVSFFQKDNNF